MTKPIHRIWSLLLITFVVFFAAVLQAQTFRGGINGSVTDTTGAVISGAKVIAAETGTLST